MYYKCKDRFFVQRILMVMLKDYKSVPKYYVCSRCSYHWKPRKTDGIPRNCPSCRSTVWMKPYDLKTCTRCGYEWGSGSENPLRCPNCGTHHWNEPVRNYSCLRCGHSWTPKRAGAPKRCPKCRSLVWNEERTGKSKLETASKASVSDLDEQTVTKVLYLYSQEWTCTRIAIELCLSFGKVFEIIRANTVGQVRI